MVASVQTVAFAGIDAIPVEVQAQVSGGLPSFAVVGLPDKAVSEARERVRAALIALGLALPAERITVNLSPADLPKEGSHFDLPIAIALLAAMDVLPSDATERLMVMGELGLDASIRSVSGVLPAALAAGSRDMVLACPAANGAEAAFAGHTQVLASPNLMDLIQHLRGKSTLAPPSPHITHPQANLPDMVDVKGQESAKRAMEIAAAGGHHILLIGPPGSGKSMLAARLPGLLPPMTPREILEASLIASVAGMIQDGALSNRRPFRDPHHSASQAALVGGGAKALPGEVSLAHNGVLFLDELPEFNRSTLEALRQPIESGRAVVARAQAHVTYPAAFQLVAAMNPCKCGYLSDESQACSRAPRCAADYQSKISGPLYDRIDLTVEVPAMMATDLTLPPPREDSAVIAARVAEARARQAARAEQLRPEDLGELDGLGGLNARVEGKALEAIAPLSDTGRGLLESAIATLRLSARGYHRVLKVARTIADLDGAKAINDAHIAEALSYRRVAPQARNALSA